MLKEIAYKSYPVLYVDDETLAVETFKLQYGGEFTILTAASGEEALHIIESEEVAVVLTDQRMPQMSGIELLHRVSTDHPEVIRILITAYTDIDLVIQAINSGNVYRYISKPYNEEEVRTILRQSIEHYFLVKERERLYAEKMETMRKIARANRLSAMGVLAAGMAHEINNPLVSISTFLQMLPQKYREPVKDTEYWEALYQVACREVERIRQLVQQLLSYSRTAETSRFESVSLNDVLQEMVLFIENEARKKGILIKRAYADNLPDGTMDRNRMKQVFLNVLLNAVQATDRGGTIVIKTRSLAENRQPFLVVEISDTGTGISQENLEKLFTPFFTTKNHEGSGLGLMTCHHIVDEHRGTIDVKSELGKGTTFTIKLPVDPLSHDRRRSARTGFPSSPLF